MRYKLAHKNLQSILRVAIDNFSWLGISLLYGKSDKYLILYKSFNAKCVARMIKSVELSNISDANSATNFLKYNINNNTQKHLLWKCFAWH